MKKIFLTTLLLTAIAGYSQVKEQQKDDKQSGDIIIESYDGEIKGEKRDITVGDNDDGSEPAINYAALKVKPEFPGGKEGLHQLIIDNIKTENLTDLSKTLLLKITISFIIEKDGTMSNIKYLAEPGHGYGPEVVRVMKNIKTRWTPGKQGDKIMRVNYILPVTFTVTK